LRVSHGNTRLVIDLATPGVSFTPNPRTRFWFVADLDDEPAGVLIAFDTFRESGRRTTAWASSNTQICETLVSLLRIG
jgi:hypothetical protein